MRSFRVCGGGITFKSPACAFSPIPQRAMTSYRHQRYQHAQRRKRTRTSNHTAQPFLSFSNLSHLPQRSTHSVSSVKLHTDCSFLPLLSLTDPRLILSPPLVRPSHVWPSPFTNKSSSPNPCYASSSSSNPSSFRSSSFSSSSSAFS